MFSEETSVPSPVSVLLETQRRLQFSMQKNFADRQRLYSWNMIMSIPFQNPRLQFSGDYPPLPATPPAPNPPTPPRHQSVCIFTLPLPIDLAEGADQSGRFPFISRLVWTDAR